MRESFPRTSSIKKKKKGETKKEWEWVRKHIKKEEESFGVKSLS